MCFNGGTYGAIFFFKSVLAEKEREKQARRHITDLKVEPIERKWISLLFQKEERERGTRPQKRER